MSVTLNFRPASRSVVFQSLVVLSSVTAVSPSGLPSVAGVMSRTLAWSRFIAGAKRKELELGHQPNAPEAATSPT